MNSFTEENYLKAIYHLSIAGQSISTNRIASALSTKPASVTDMLKKLAEKKLINYIPYQGVKLTLAGEKTALNIIRKHRLWEYFLVSNLKFKWDEVHDLAEELEHIQSDELINRLDEFLNHPQYDPHGDPIPDTQGAMLDANLKLISSLPVQSSGRIAAVSEHSPSFLQYLEKLQLTIGALITLIEFVDYDHSLILKLEGGQRVNISREVAKHILITV
jgi:DtxR family Mn-dependent transcriptional regulator